LFFAFLFWAFVFAVSLFIWNVKKKLTRSLVTALILALEKAFVVNAQLITERTTSFQLVIFLKKKKRHMIDL